LIYDCFTFFNEVELLELRLRTLWDTVDRFILVEADRTHAGQPKAFIFEQRQALFEQYREKITYVKVSDMPEGPDVWGRENFQRNCIARALTGCSQEDLIMISDADEIPRPEIIISLLNSEEGKTLLEHHPVAFAQRNYYYFVNCIEPVFWHGTVATRYKNLRTPQEARNNRERMPRIRYGGWHFSYLGGVQRVIEKFNAYAHQEFNNSLTNSAENVREIISQGLSTLQMDKRPGKYYFVQLDDTYPAPVREVIAQYPVLFQQDDGLIDGFGVYPAESTSLIYNKPRWYWYLLKKALHLV
jgi:beta-1,4-mannosyl-glycoprotein beta-1,4-N-acetylglucosaminyltransferase